MLGYWYPEDKKGLIGNDTITIPANAPHPRLAHEFLNFFLDEKWGYENFAGLERLPAAVHVDRSRPAGRRRGRRARALASAVLGEEDFTQGYIQSELTPEADQIWLDAWNEIQAGG